MIQSLVENINTNWKQILLEICETNSLEIDKLNKFLEEEEVKFKGISSIYPPKNQIFNAFNYFNIEDLQVILIGQDPYHQKNQANGLCFSVNENIKLPPSLRNIFKELKDDLGIQHNNGNLESWAKQGILLLNTSLSVRESKPNSHSKYWTFFTNEIIKKIVKKKKDIVFILWGNHAKKLKNLLTTDEILNNYFLEAHHPSPLSANRGGWFGCKHFSKTNKILKNKIKW